ncbi:MAG: hypothetical protein KDF58_05995 [Alphaproteobacteria bacterium]|nr:hypothetical protein [Alphaproteobacteria bacterium]HPF45366.1 hypothetical protein [Emcibacteraceae bacterium]
MHSSGSTLLGPFDIRTSSGIFGVLLGARTELNNGPIYEFELDGNYYSDRHIQLLKILTA